MPVAIGDSDFELELVVKIEFVLPFSGTDPLAKCFPGGAVCFLKGALEFRH